MTCKELRDAVDDTGCINTAQVLAADPNMRRSMTGSANGQGILRLALEIFHNIEESVIDIWLVSELNLDLVEVAESILQINRSVLKLSRYMI